MNRHPRAEELWEFAQAHPESKSRHDERSRVALHLGTGCERCQRRVEQIRQIVRALAEPVLEAAPAAWVVNARRALQAQSQLQARPQQRSRNAARNARGPRSIVRAAAEAVGQFRAALVLDSQAHALAGIRGARRPAFRTLRYESEVGEVYLQLQADQDPPRLQGQLTPLSSLRIERGRAVLEGGRRPVVRRIGPDGQFSFRSVPRGRIQLRIEWGGRTLILDPIHVGAGAASS